jgi:hypothetical protein
MKRLQLACRCPTACTAMIMPSACHADDAFMAVTDVLVATLCCRRSKSIKFCGCCGFYQGDAACQFSAAPVFQASIAFRKAQRGLDIPLSNDQRALHCLVQRPLVRHPLRAEGQHQQGQHQVSHPHNSWTAGFSSFRRSTASSGRSIACPRSCCSMPEHCCMAWWTSQPGWTASARASGSSAPNAIRMQWRTASARSAGQAATPTPVPSIEAVRLIGSERYDHINKSISRKSSYQQADDQHDQQSIDRSAEVFMQQLAKRRDAQHVHRWTLPDVQPDAAAAAAVALAGAAVVAGTSSAQQPCTGQPRKLAG